MLTARVVGVSHIDGAETIEVNGHRIQFGEGSGGDGFCYAHQSFKCLDNLSEEEMEAVRKAERPGPDDLE